MLIILCVDDAGMAAPNKEITNDLVKELRDEGFNLETEGDFTECLGIGMEHRDDGTVCMTQKGLIKKIILATAKMEGCNLNKTPALLTALGSDAEGAPWNQDHWDCASIVSMLLCASNNTRPDIAFAASQVARCTACPKESHARAIKCIVRYLAGTINRGVTMKHDGAFDLKVWADADFARTFGQEPSGNAESVKS